MSGIFLENRNTLYTAEQQPLCFQADVEVKILYLYAQTFETMNFYVLCVCLALILKNVYGELCSNMSAWCFLFVGHYTTVTLHFNRQHNQPVGAIDCISDTIKVLYTHKKTTS